MKKYCRNCYHPLPYKAKFCAHCGQKDTDGRIGMRSLMGRLWNNTFHLEGKFLRTAWQLFVPGKVTTEFFKGKQDRYPHPIRLFAIVMFLFLFLLNSMLKDPKPKEDDSNTISFVEHVETERGDSVVQDKDFILFDQLKHKVVLDELRHGYENLPADWRTPQSYNSVDSLMKGYGDRYNIETVGLLDGTSGNADTIPIDFFFGKSIDISAFDIVRYEPDEIIHHYNITHWLDKLILRQGIKSYKAPDVLAHAYIGSLTWAILALIAIMSGVLALLYRRQQRYYVEHFIFLLHFHTGAMLLLLLAILGNRWGIWDEDMIIASAFWPVPATYIALWRYYGDGWLKTFFKWLLYGALYLFAFALSFILGLLVVFAVF